MKAKLLLFFLVTVIVWSCDEKRLAPDEIKPVVGKWASFLPLFIVSTKM